MNCKFYGARQNKCTTKTEWQEKFCVELVRAYSMVLIPLFCARISWLLLWTVFQHRLI